MEVVARVGIEPTTRGFSAQRRAQFGASKAKTGKGFPRRRPNRPARPSPYRTVTPKFRPNPRGADPDQRLARIATEPLPNRQPNGTRVAPAYPGRLGRSRNYRQDIRRRERKQQSFKSQRSAQQFLATHAAVHENFSLQRYPIRRSALRLSRAEAGRTWAATTAAARAIAPSPLIARPAT